MSAFRHDGRSQWTGLCAAHPDVAASFTCARCGDHGCLSCERRVVPTAQPICPECWRRREARVDRMAEDSGAHLPLWSVALGVVALVPLLWPAQLGAVLVGMKALGRLEPDAPRRALAYVGIALGLVGGLGSCLAFATLTS